MGVHVAHTSCRHGPSQMAGQGGHDVPVLVVAGSAGCMGAVVGQSAPLDEGWQCCGGLP